MPRSSTLPPPSDQPASQLLLVPDPELVARVVLGEKECVRRCLLLHAAAPRRPPQIVAHTGRPPGRLAQAPAPTAPHACSRPTLSATNLRKMAQSSSWLEGVVTRVRICGSASVRAPRAAHERAACLHPDRTGECKISHTRPVVSRAQAVDACINATRAVLTLPSKEKYQLGQLRELCVSAARGLPQRARGAIPGSRPSLAPDTPRSTPVLLALLKLHGGWAARRR